MRRLNFKDGKVPATIGKEKHILIHTTRQRLLSKVFAVLKYPLVYN